MCNCLACGDGVADGNPDRFDSGIFAGYDLPLAMRRYLMLSVDEAITSPNTLVRALAVVDRRVGQRRLARFEAATESSLVVQMLALRRGVGDPRAA